MEKEVIEKAKHSLIAETDFILIAFGKKIVSFKVIHPDKLSGL